MSYKHLYKSNRKEYYRRKRISISLKRYWENFKKIKVRKRTQLVYNSGYGISARIIIINGTKSLNQLRRELDFWLLHNQDKLVFLLGDNNPNFDEEALENENIDDEEDKNLKDGISNIEIYIRRKVIRDTI